MFKRLTILLVLIATLAVPTSAFAAPSADGHEAMVSVIHGIPGPEGLPVDVSVDGTCALEGFTFKEIAGPMAMPTGTYKVVISLADSDEPCSNDPVIGPASLTFDGGKNYTVIAHLTADGKPTASLYENNVSPLPAGTARATVRHNAAAPAVDVELKRRARGWEPAYAASLSDAALLGGGDKGGKIRWKTILIEDLSNPDEAQAEFRAGKWIASVFAAGTDLRVLGPAPVNFGELTATFIYAVGSLEDDTLTLITQVFDVALGASVNVIHGINGLDLELSEALPVDVSVNGACALTNFEFKDIAGPITMAEGTYEIAISVANPDDPCGNDPVIGPANVPFEAGENASVIAYLDMDGEPTAAKFVNDLSDLRGNNARVAVRHTAVALTVDVKLQRTLNSRYAVEFPDLSNGDEEVRDTWLGKWLGLIFPAGDSTPVFGPAELELKPFTYYEVYAVGTFPDTFSLIVNTIPTQVY